MASLDLRCRYLRSYGTWLHRCSGTCEHSERAVQARGYVYGCFAPESSLRRRHSDKPQLAVSTQVFGERVVTAQHLEVMRNAGFQIVEVFAAPGHFAWDDAHAVGRMAGWLKGLDMRVCSLHAPWAPGQDIAALDDAQRERSLQAVERAADALASLGGQYLIVHPGATLEDPRTKDKQLRLAQDSLARVAAYCRSRGVRMALENPPPYELGGQTSDMLRALRAFRRQSRRLRLLRHRTRAHHQRGRALHCARAGGRTVIHLSDNTGAADDHWPPPQGTIRWAEFFAVLAQRRWAGYLVLELTDRPTRRGAGARGGVARRRCWRATACELTITSTAPFSCSRQRRAAWLRQRLHAEWVPSGDATL